MLYKAMLERLVESLYNSTENLYNNYSSHFYNRLSISINYHFVCMYFFQGKMNWVDREVSFYTDVIDISRYI